MKTPYPFYDRREARGEVRVGAMTGIVSYGAYVPPTRLAFSTLAGRPARKGDERRPSAPSRGTTKTA